MKKYLILSIVAFPLSFVAAQNVGIGTTQPSELLHVKDGSIRLEGNNTYFDLHTNTGFGTGLRFHANNAFKGGWFYQLASNRLNLTNSIFINGFVYDLNSNKSFFGRDFSISGAESFGIRSPVTSETYGGMYMETSGNVNAKPFYGYAIDSVSKAWHYYDGADNRWKLFVGGNRISVENTGNVGIGILDPAERLHVLSAIRVDGGNPIIRFQDGTTQRAYFQHNSPTLLIRNVENGQLQLGTNNTTHITIDPSGEVGIGTVAPSDKLHVTGTIRIDNPGTPQLRFHQGATFAGFIQSSGTEFTVSNKLTGNLTFRTNDIARMAITNGGNIGINELAPSDKMHLTGGNLRIENTSAQISFYQGNTFGAFIQSSPENMLISNKNSGELQLRTNDIRRLAITNSGDVVIGVIAPATGYRLNVDGKIIAEELKVQMSDLWPDYVFKETYPLLSLPELKEYVSVHQHLPGIPSASDVTSAEGIEVGEMNRLLLEKIEELTLYIIDLQDQIDTLRDH